MSDELLLQLQRANPDMVPFWDAAKRDVLLIKSCRSCKRTHWYPRSICPFCIADQTEWVEASGAGNVYSYSASPRAEPPYIVAYVTLAEGPQMVTNLVDFGESTPRIDEAVTLTFRDTSLGLRMPMFAPSSKRRDS